MQLQSLARTGAALCVLSAFANSQSVVWDGGDAAGDVIPLPSEIQGAIGRSCAGDFDQDGTVDAAYIIGGKIVILRSPESWAVVQDTGVSANDIESSGTIGTELFPTIVYVNSSGLHQLTFSGGTFVSQTIVSGGAWANSKRVRVRTIPSPSGPSPVPLPRRFYVGYTQSQTTYGVPSREVQGPLVTDRSFSPGEMGGDFVLPIWDATGQPIVAMVCYSGLQLRRLDGTVVRDVTNVGPRGDAVASVRIAGDSFDRVAWMRRTDLTNQELLVMGSDSGDVSVPVTSAGSRALAMRTTDLTEASAAGPDGNTELILADQSSWEPRLAWNSGIEELFDLSGVQRPLNQDESSASSNVSWPLAADFTLDGSIDLLAPSQGGTSFRLFEAMNPMVPRAFWGEQVFWSIHAGAHSSGTGIEKLALELVPSGLSNAGVTFDWLQVVVWVQQTFSAPMEPIGNYLYHIDPDLQTPLPLLDGHLIPVVSLVHPQLSPNGLQCDDENRVFWIQFRGRTAPGTLSGSNGPWWNLFFTANHDATCALKTGTTGFRGLADSVYSEDVPCANEEFGLGCFGSTQMPAPSATPGGAWGLRPAQRLTGGTRRVIAPGNVPAATLPSPGPETVYYEGENWGLIAL